MTSEQNTRMKELKRNLVAKAQLALEKKQLIDCKCFERLSSSMYIAQYFVVCREI